MDDVVALHAFPLPTERYHAFLLNDVVNEDVPDLETVA